MLFSLQRIGVDICCYLPQTVIEIVPENQTRLAINGAAGRMGRQLLAAVAEHSGALLGAAVDAPGHPCIGAESSVLGGGESGVIVQDSVRSAIGDFSAIIDFTVPDAALRLLDSLQGTSKSVVIGTTGFDQQQLALIRTAARELPIVFAPNYSIGVTLTLSLLEHAAKTLGADYDVEIMEAHHRHKIDSPSGTALRMGEVVAAALGRDLQSCAIYGREGITGARDANTIGFATIRAGDIIGEHTVLFAGNGERIEITHKATDRMAFARGAVRAALWLNNQPPGLYDMTHVLGISENNA